MMSLLPFWALNVSVPLRSIQGQRALRLHQKYLYLCSDEWRWAYGFETTWGWVSIDRIFIFGWTIPLISKNNPEFKAIPCNCFLVKISWKKWFTVKTSKWWVCFLQTHSFSLHKMLTDGLEWCGLLIIIVMDLLIITFCDVFISCFVLSFWWYPFTAEDPLVNKWCNA